MLTKSTAIDSISVNAIGIISAREATTILEDGVVLTVSYHRKTLVPGSDLSGEDARVVAVAEAAWTPDVLQAYQDRLAAAEQS
jgi:hypothetical protein